MFTVMDIQTYVTKHGGTGKRDCPVIKSVADSAGCSAGTLYMIALGHKRPSGLLAGAIESATSGAVSRQELRPDIFTAPAKTKAA